MRTLIKGDTVVSASDLHKGDVLVEDEEIALVGTLDMTADTVIDATGNGSFLRRSTG